MTALYISVWLGTPQWKQQMIWNFWVSYRKHHYLPLCVGSLRGNSMNSQQLKVLESYLNSAVFCCISYIYLTRTHKHTTTKRKRRFTCFIDPSFQTSCGALRLIWDDTVRHRWIIRASIPVFPVPCWPPLHRLTVSAFTFSPETFHSRLAAVYFKLRENYWWLQDSVKPLGH